jgi:NADPH:quinone reductase-like Zn-dependent oxidoreductase
VAADDVIGTMADKALASARWSIALPDDADIAKVAAAMNPARSSWVALRRRVPIEPGQSVLVLGATGNAGAMAVQVARRLGAGRVVGAGRDPGRLGALTSAGADDVVQLTGDDDATARALAAAAAESDVVLDYLWGKPAQSAIPALLTARSDRSREMNWIQIGSVAGPAMELPSAALRSASFRLQGSGQGSVLSRACLAELPSLVAEITAGTIAVNATEPVRKQSKQSVHGLLGLMACVTRRIWPGRPLSTPKIVKGRRRAWATLPWTVRIMMTPGLGTSMRTGRC